MSDIYLIGDKIVDRYIEVTPKKISAEAPILVYEDLNVEPIELPGGADNIRALLEQLGNTVNFRFGWDIYSPNPDKPHLRLKTFPTKTRLVADGVQIARYDSNDHVQTPVAPAGSGCCGGGMPDLDAYDAIVVADYGKGTIRDAGTIAVFSQWLSSRNRPAPIYIHTKGSPALWLRQKLTPPPIFFCNRSEYAEHINAYDHAELVVRTLGPAGAELVRFGEPFYWLPSFAERINNVSGAGDSFMAGFIHEHLQSGVPQQSLLVGGVAAALTMSRPYCGYIESPEEIYERIEEMQEVANAELAEADETDGDPEDGQDLGS